MTALARAHGVHEFVQQRAVTTPNATALWHGAQRLTYAELNTRANRLAYKLIELGVRPERVVGLALTRSPMLYVSLLAIFKAGGAYLPIDPAYPRDLVTSMLDDAGATTVLSEAGGLPGLDVDGPDIATYPDTDPEIVRDATNLAYCIYTSGSTGRPKGVDVSMASLLNHAGHMREELRLTAADRVLQFTPITIDAALEEILPAWLAGAAVVVPTEPVLTSQELTRLLDERQVTVVSLPSSYWHQWVGDLCEGRVTRPRSVRMVFVGGERLRADRLRQWLDLGWPVEWLADYGPTEATISCTTYRGGPVPGSGTVPIGRPIANMTLRLLDQHLNPVADGVEAEIYLAGVGLARGYRGRPDLTAVRFLPDPYGPPGSRMYRTGDIGYCLPDGNVQFVGRADHQIKIRGYRIEPGQVEHALTRCDGVREAVVVADEGSTRLVAYVVVDGSDAGGFDEGAVRRQVTGLLPPAMIPNLIVPLDALPRFAASGKVDRSRLPKPVAAQSTVDLPPLERAVAALFSDVTGRSPGEDGFIADGGDSLRGLQLLGRLADVTGVDLSYPELLTASTVDGVVAAVRVKRGDARIARGSGGGRRVASRAQRRLWFLHKMRPDTATYSVPFAYRIRGPLSIDRLDTALNALIQRHEALRTAFAEEGGTLWQQVSAKASVRTEMVDGRDVAAEAARPFDLTRAPLLRSVCFCLGDDDHLWLLNIHHAVFDAWSLGVFWREFAALYQGKQLPTPAPQHADHVEWQEQWLTSARADRQREFWREFWRDRRAGTQTTGSPATTDAGFVEPLGIADLDGQVDALARTLGTTPFVILLAAFFATLHRTTRDERVVVGVPAACRTRPGAEDIIGYLANTLALPMEFDPDLRFEDLVERTGRILSAALAHQELPFDEVVSGADAVREADETPLFRTMFVMQSTPLHDLADIDGLDITEEPVHSGTAKFDLTCAVRRGREGLTGEVEFRADRYDRSSAARWRASFRHVLTNALARPRTRVDELPMMSPIERAGWVARINGARESGTYGLLHEWVEEQARRTPDAVAVETGGRLVRYRDLNAAADGLAGALAAAGAGRDSLVGISLPRSIELVVAVLATLKAGAGFVPLDPRFPANRRKSIVDDSGLVAVVGPVDGAAVPMVPPDARAAPVRVGAHLADVAYVYYTSGSTGRPKGVVIDHRCASNRVDWIRRRYGLRPGDRVVHKTPLVFDVAIWEIFATLAAGATIVLADAGAETDVPHLAGLLAAPGTVLAHFVPSMLDMYLATAADRIYPNLGWVQTSGEAVPVRLLERFAEHFPVALHAVYGQTETSEVAEWCVRGGVAEDLVPIGRQVGIYRLFVLDDAMNPLPPGVCGELCVAGIGGLARGYLGRPDLTAERFVPNPFAVEPGERLYRTGDLAVLDEGGVLHYRGRADAQVKIRGVRIELGEVEAVLTGHPAVRQCTATVHGDDIVAYVVGSASASELATHAARFLSHYMLPAAYVGLDALPVTPSGKVDRLRLPAPTPADRAARACNGTPAPGLESELAELVREVARVERVGSADNFFSIGGNSLNSLQVLHRVGETFGVEVTVREFFGDPTIRGLAACVERKLADMVASLPDDEVARRLGELGA